MVRRSQWSRWDRANPETKPLLKRAKVTLGLLSGMSPLKQGHCLSYKSRSLDSPSGPFDGPFLGYRLAVFGQGRRKRFSFLPIG